MKRSPREPRRRRADLVAFCGRSGSGKDAAAAFLVQRHGFRRIAVADHLKRVAALAFSLTDEQLWGDGRNVPDPTWGRTPRELYQQLGDALRAIAPDALTRGWIAEIRAGLEAGARVVVPDLRMPDEHAAVRRLGGLVIRLLRADAQLRGDAAAHSTELASDAFDVDREIRNDGTLADLHARVRRAIAARAPQRERHRSPPRQRRETFASEVPPRARRRRHARS